MAPHKVFELMHAQLSQVLPNPTTAIHQFVVQSTLNPAHHARLSGNQSLITIAIHFSIQKTADFARECYSRIVVGIFFPCHIVCARAIRSSVAPETWPPRGKSAVFLPP